MILCEKPWYNEPGRERRPDEPASTRYNNEVRAWTLRYAILPWARSVSAREGGGVLARGVSPVTRRASQPGDATPFWRETAQLYLRAHAADILNGAEEALRLTKVDRTGLRQAMWEIRDVFAHQGYLI